jgi:hypothetical protein
MVSGGAALAAGLGLQGLRHDVYGRRPDGARDQQRRRGRGRDRREDRHLRRIAGDDPVLLVQQWSLRTRRLPLPRGPAGPYDAVVRSNTWTTTLPAATIARAYPAVGTVQALQVLARDGYWRYGGRVVSIKIKGSAASATVTGLAFRLATGLRSTLFVIDEAS